MSPITLALIGMLCWGIGPIFAKLGLRGVDPLTGLCVRTMIAGMLVSSWSVMASRARHFHVISARAVVLITIEAILATVVGDLAYYAAMKKGDCGQVSVILSASPMVTILLSVGLLGERASVANMVGAGLITLGLIFVSVQPR